MRRLLLAAFCTLTLVDAPLAAQEERSQGSRVPANRLPLRVSDNGRHLEDVVGRPFLWLGDTAWLLTQKTTREEAERYLATRAQQGFTVIQAAVVMGLEGLAGTLSPNAYGDQAFVAGDPSRPATTAGNNPDRPEEYDYWDHVDFIVQRAAALGLRVGLVPLFVGFLDEGFRYLTLGNAFGYGRFLGERYRGSFHVIWILGGDSTPDSAAKRRVWDEVARGITVGATGTEDYSRTLMTYHAAYTASSNSSSQWFHNSPWLDFNMAQVWGAEPAIYSQLTRDYARTPAKPMGLGEGSYEDGPQYPTRPVNPLSIRRQAYWSYFAGGYHTYGNTNVWNFGTHRTEVTDDWLRALDSPGAQHLSVLARVLADVGWWQFTPDPSLFVTGAVRGTMPNAAMRSSTGDRLFAYLSTAGSVTLRLDAVTRASVMRATWIDPQSGSRHAIGAFPVSAAVSFTPPAGWPDALLLIQAAGGRDQ